MTEWRAIHGYEGYYEVSSDGRIRSVDRAVAGSYGSIRRLRGQEIRPSDDGRGYLRVCLHRAVALAFLGPRPAGMEICHNDGDPTNNALTNLRYDTHLANEMDKLAHGTSRAFIAGDACVNGHAYTPENTLLTGGERRCRTCKRKQYRALDGKRRSAA